MNSPDPAPSLEDVLDAFAVEAEADSLTLQRYLKTYPQFAERLIDLSRELSREPVEEAGRLNSQDTAKIEAAWKAHLQAATIPIADPLANLTVDKLRELSRVFGIPRQVFTAFRERKVEITSVPRPFLAQFAAVLKLGAEQLAEALSLPPAPQMVRSYKADVKPGVQKRVTFEQILIEAGVTEEQRAKLMAES